MTGTNPEGTPADGIDPDDLHLSELYRRIAGGSVRDLFGKPLGYGKAGERFKNPSFVARGR